MAKKTLAGRPGSGTARQRSVVAATVRAAAKKAEKAEKSEQPERPEQSRRNGQAEEPDTAPHVAGRTVVIEGDTDADAAAYPDADAAGDLPESSGTLKAPKASQTGKAGKTSKTSEASGGSRPRTSREPLNSSEGDSEEPGAAGTPADPAAEEERNRRPRATRSMRGLRGMSGLRFRPGPVRALTALLAVAALTGTVLLGLEYRDVQRTEQARTDAMAAARKAAPEILSYDHKNLDKNFKAAGGHLTGGFAAKYQKTTKSVVGPTAKKYKGVVKASVAKPPGGEGAAVSVVSASPEKVVVLLFLNQVTENSQLDQPRVDLNRVRMTMVETSGQWKVSELEAM